MYFLDPALLRTRLTLEDKDEVNEVLKSAITGGTQFVESVLDTELGYGEHECLFFLEPSFVAGKTFQLRMPHGFVRPGAGTPLVGAPVVSFSYSDVGFSTFEGFMGWDYERGVLNVSSDLSGAYVKVSYSHGFKSLKEVPAWLTEALLVSSVKVLSMQVVNDGKDNLSKVFAYLDTHRGAILDRHLRAGSFLIRPVF